MMDGVMNGPQVHYSVSILSEKQSQIFAYIKQYFA